MRLNLKQKININKYISANKLEVTAIKKLVLFILTILLSLGLCGCSYRDWVAASLPEYNSKVFYTSGGWQDYTDYAKYSYDSITAQDIEASRYFTAATEEDVEEILLYIENFEAWVEAVGGELKDNYDFDKTNVSEGDFFYIETKYGEPIGERTYGKFENYTVFYFDVDAQVLYYFYNNI